MTQPAIDSTAHTFLDEAKAELQSVLAVLHDFSHSSQWGNELERAFRSLHTVKSSAHLFEFKFVGTVVHVIESALEHMWDRRVPADRLVWKRVVQLTGNLAESVDRLAVGESESDIEKDISDSLGDLVSRLTDVQEGFQIDAGERYLCAASIASQVARERAFLWAKSRGTGSVPTSERDSRGVSQLIELNDSPRVGMAVRQKVVTRDARSLRVEIGALDRLMHLLEELVLIRNQHRMFERRASTSDLSALNQRLNIVTTEMRAEVMSARMQPFSTILMNIETVMQSMAHQQNKEISLSVQGADVEIDTVMLDSLRDSLLHLVRNAVDHGIEEAGERRKAGKPAVGCIEIRAKHEGGQIIVEVVDDGVGLDRDAILARAIERRMDSKESLEALPDRELYQIISEPRFSTSETVTDVSGRGMGLNAVRSYLEQVGGSLRVLSKAGEGVSIRMRAPQTLAIVPVLVVGVCGQRFAIPQARLVELFHLDEDEVSANFERIHDQLFFRLRGDLIPLVSLRSFLRLVGSESQGVKVVVLRSEAGVFGALVDKVIDSIDVVVKPLLSSLKGLSIYDGSTVLGDGEVVLVLDVYGLAHTIGLRDSVEERSSYGLLVPPSGSHEVLADYLIVDIGTPGQYALPMSLVERLEEFCVESVECSGRTHVVQYRDHLLPIMSLSEVLGFPVDGSMDDAVTMRTVVVVRCGEDLYGFEVQTVKDILSTSAKVDEAVSDRVGLSGGLLVGRDIITLIDVPAIIGRFQDVMMPSEGRR